MEDRYIKVPGAIPEMFARSRGEIAETKGDVSLFLASGEEVPAVKGAKLYLNDTIVSRDDGAILASFGDAGVLLLGQNQQIHLHSDFFHRINSLVQAITPVTRTQLAGAIEITKLELAIQTGRNIEQLFDKSVVASKKVNALKTTFYQRAGGTLLPISSFEASAFRCAPLHPIDEFGDTNIGSRTEHVHISTIQNQKN